ncbi:DEAD/DEAH box helicase [Vibrio campbellii]|uniref:DEAD/DEAH box helicase n=1 Tax=Vibrio campbellii TaxID=680 RepID=UPI0040574730
MLRIWQQECIDEALKSFLYKKRHFLAQATPGAGKTRMAAHLAKQMFDKKLIDFVICFSPSRAVSNSIAGSFSEVLGGSFDGRLGSLGCSMTYQSLRYLDEQFWHTLSKYRVLCIFDEIHHCAGDSDTNTNSWGHHILYDVQRASTYTLALTGTPWRSDLTPVVLSSYTDPDGEIVCDYQYSLAQAVQDGVCRKPTIALIDCDESTVEIDNQVESFQSLNELISEGEINYSTILNNKLALHHVLDIAVTRLAKIRTQSPSAGGLIVAASVSHAAEIASLLKNSFGQTTTIVTYKNDDSQERIERFRSNRTEWIVSVGMVSEGTDIPRLQVCCHLSNITTELYFRQILGRILRMTSSQNQEAWLYTFAAPKLVAFAEEVEKDIPESCIYLKQCQEQSHDSEDTLSANRTSVATEHDKETLSISFSEGLSPNHSQPSQNEINGLANLSLRNFKQRVIEAFRYGH